MEWLYWSETHRQPGKGITFSYLELRCSISVAFCLLVSLPWLVKVRSEFQTGRDLADFSFPLLLLFKPVMMCASDTQQKRSRVMNVHSYPRQKMCLRKKVMKSDLSSHSKLCTGAQTSRDSGIATETSDIHFSSSPC